MIRNKLIIPLDLNEWFLGGIKLNGSIVWGSYPEWGSQIELDFLVEELFLNIWFNPYYLNNFQLISVVFSVPFQHDWSPHFIVCATLWRYDFYQYFIIPFLCVHHFLPLVLAPFILNIDQISLLSHIPRILVI